MSKFAQCDISQQKIIHKHFWCFDIKVIDTIPDNSFKSVFTKKGTELKKCQRI